MKSHKEVKEACDLMGKMLSGHLPIYMTPEAKQFIEAQYHVLCFVLECDGDGCFKNVLARLRQMLAQVDAGKQRQPKQKVLILVE